jgi:alpha-amylase
MHKFNNDCGIVGASDSIMSVKVQVKNQLIAKPASTKPLATVPFEKGFHFYTTMGNYTGITATNLNEFAAKLQIIPNESIAFHFQRKDFENWIRYTIKDVALAEKISKTKAEQSTENLRKEIFRTVEKSTLCAF